MADNNKTFRYLSKEDYDKKLKINGEEVPLYSRDRLDALFPDRDYVLAGETFEKRKRNREKDIGRIELADKWLYVAKYGSHSKFFRKIAAYAEVEDGGFIALLRLRLLPFLILLLLLCVGAAIPFLPKVDKGAVKPVDPTKEDPNMAVVTELYYTVSGTVTKAGAPVEGAGLSLQKGNTEIAATTTDAEGKYGFADVTNGNYNVVCTVGDSVLTKAAYVVGDSVIVDFAFPDDDLHDVGEITNETDETKLPKSEPTEDDSIVKALLKIIGKNTPPIAVQDLYKEALLHMIAGREVDITLLAEQLDAGKVPEADRAAIEAISGELDLSWFDFSVLKEVYKNGKLESSEYLTKTKTVLEIAVPYDSSNAAGTYVFRYHGGEAYRFTQLTEKPTDSFIDGTCFVSIDTVYIYTDSFCTYAIGRAATDAPTKGSDMLVFSDGADVNVTEKSVSMYYSHDKTATHNARVELYLSGRTEDLLVAQSGIIPPGNELSVMPLAAKASDLPSADSYEGYLLVIYLGADGKSVSTNVQLPVTVTILPQ